MFWIWVHLLQFDLSNQTLDPNEDIINKSDRPLPSKRISLRAAIYLRWALIPACWILSSIYSRETVYSSITLVALTFIYNEFTAHSSHWLSRNVVNACGFGSFETGATLIASTVLYAIFIYGYNSSLSIVEKLNHSSILSLITGGDVHVLDSVATWSIFVSMAIFTTTIQTQDFKDEVGDRAVGRRTIPILFPTVGRCCILPLLSLWSIGLTVVWQLDSITSILYTLLSVFVGLRFLLLKSVESDQLSFYWYNVSLVDQCWPGVVLVG